MPSSASATEPGMGLPAAEGTVGVPFPHTLPSCWGDGLQSTIQQVFLPSGALEPPRAALTVHPKLEGLDAAGRCALRLWRPEV